MVDAGHSCACCGAPLPDADAPGPRKAAVFCSNACRQRAYRRRRQQATKRASPALRPRNPAAGPPLSVDRFVGRQGELMAIARLLRTSRLITVFGPAGVGKTRLALELANRIQRSFTGVYVVELGPLTRPELVSRAVAAAVGVSEQPSIPLLDTLTASLRGEHVLIVLDNCEHLVDACSEFVAALLRHCPGPHVLATSREALRLPGEMIFPSSELPLADAVDLFADRAGAVAPGFVLDDGNRGLAELICQRLDRLPLAGRSGCSRCPTSPTGWPTGSRCSPHGSASPTPGTATCSAPSTGATTCSARPSRRSSGGCPRCPVASTWSWSKPSAPIWRCPAPRSSTSSTRWSPSR